MLFNDEGPKVKAKKIILSVKGGENINSGMIRDLKGTVEREKAAMGIFITLTNPTKAMITEAANSGVYIPKFIQNEFNHASTPNSFPKIQVITIEELLQGKKPKLPPDFTSGGATFKKNRTVAEADTLKPILS